jgi:amino acid transporter
MLIISVIGIRITARIQVAIGVVEYAILIAFAVWGLYREISHHGGTLGISSSWFSLAGVGGKGSLVAGFLITVFMYSGWDGTLYMNEETKHRRENPGRAAMLAVGIAAILFILAQVGLRSTA